MTSSFTGYVRSRIRSVLLCLDVRCVETLKLWLCFIERRITGGEAIHDQYGSTLPVLARGIDSWSSVFTGTLW